MFLRAAAFWRKILFVRFCNDCRFSHLNLRETRAAGRQKLFSRPSLPTIRPPQYHSPTCLDCGRNAFRNDASPGGARFANKRAGEVFGGSSFFLRFFFAQFAFAPAADFSGHALGDFFGARFFARWQGFLKNNSPKDKKRRLRFGRRLKFQMKRDSICPPSLTAWTLQGRNPGSSLR